MFGICMSWLPHFSLSRPPDYPIITTWTFANSLRGMNWWGVLHTNWYPPSCTSPVILNQSLHIILQECPLPSTSRDPSDWDSAWGWPRDWVDCRECSANTRRVLDCSVPCIARGWHGSLAACSWDAGELDCAAWGPGSAWRNCWARTRWAVVVAPPDGDVHGATGGDGDDGWPGCELATETPEVLERYN